MATDFDVINIFVWNFGNLYIRPKLKFLILQKKFYGPMWALWVRECVLPKLSICKNVVR